MAFVKGQSGNPSGRPKAVTADGRTLQQIAREHTDMAVNALVHIAMHGESEAARASSAQALLDRGWGRAPQSVTVSGDAENPLNLAVDLSKLSTDQLRVLASISLGD